DIQYITPMNFTFHQLQIFLEVARHQNITKAAEEMYMTQPALSIQLKNFQSQFEIALVEKIGKRIYLTDFGKAIAEVAENILKEADALRYKTKEYKGLLTGRLRISSASTGKYVIPYFLSAFMHQYPGIDLTLDVSNKTKVLQSLRANEIDFAIVSVLPEKLAVEEELLVENKLFLVGNTPHLIESRPLLYREEGSATRGAMEHYFGNPTKRKSIELTSNEAVKQAVMAGLGYSILPMIGIKNELANEQLHIIPSTGLPITTHWRLIWLKNKKLSPVAQAYLAYVKAEKETIIKEAFNWYIAA
ncbi:MAG: LysR substrate-binding domain-containing protein, partial [Bacteroidota bacterium]